MGRYLSTILSVLLLVVLANAHPHHHRYDGLDPECPVSITTNRQSCAAMRLVDIQRARYWYQLTDGNTKTPSRTSFLFKNDIPWLNQSTDAIQYYYAIDPFESRYMMLLATMRNIVTEKIMPPLFQAFKSFPFVTNREYVALHQAWNGALAQLRTPQYFANPTQYPDFTDHSTNKYWETDDAFTQRRLAGICPIFMKKVYCDETEKHGITFEKLESVLNMKFFENFKMKINDHVELTIEQALADERLFVQYIDEMDNFMNSVDLTDTNRTDSRQLRKIRSPIAVFILKEDGNLAVVAIQEDPNNDSRVLTPSNSRAQEWLLLKAQVEQTAIQYCHGKIHLGSVHFVTTIYCLSFRRHLSTKHPLYDFFKYHCEGTVPHITLTFNSVTDKGEAIDQIFAVGANGPRILAKKAIDERNYETFTFDGFIKGQGMDDRRIKYYPFRDDAAVLLAEYGKFAKEWVESIYDHHNCIKDDHELQEWVAELSDSSKGKMVGFPTTFYKKKQLETFLQRFLWYNVIHTAVNYATPEFRPVSPIKLYEDKSGIPLTLLQSLPSAVHSLTATTFLGTLASFRINRIFGYWEQITDQKFRKIIRKYQHRLIKNVQKTLAQRNAQRKANNQLGYQYLEPRWLTNSIHI